MIGELELACVGLNHRTAPVELRERFAVPSDQLVAHYDELRRAEVHETVILSTCNRVEFYALVPSDGQRLVDHLARWRGLRRRQLEPHLYTHVGVDAVTHLFRVASSLDSMVLGEPQILGQVKQAFRGAESAQAAGRILHLLMRRALTVAKRVRTETAIGREPVSMGRAGVELARQVFGRLEGRGALMVGAGEMGRLVARSLLDHGVDELVVANRTYVRAVELAQAFGGTAAHLDQLGRYLEQVDIVLTSTGATEHLLTRRELAKVMRARRFRPLFCIDLSVPRNIEPACNDLEGAFVFNVDDLSRVAARGMERRRAEAELAEGIVRSEAERCYRSLGARSADPVIASMTRRAEAARLQELRRSEALLSTLSPEQREVIEAMTRSMFKRFLHHPIQSARTAGSIGDDEALSVLGSAFTGDDEEDAP